MIKNGYLSYICLINIFCFVWSGVSGIPGQMGPQGIPGIPGLDGCNGTDVCIMYLFLLQKYLNKQNNYSIAYKKFLPVKNLCWRLTWCPMGYGTYCLLLVNKIVKSLLYLLININCKYLKI